MRAGGCNLQVRRAREQKHCEATEANRLAHSGLGNELRALETRNNEATSYCWRLNAMYWFCAEILCCFGKVLQKVRQPYQLGILYSDIESQLISMCI